jgi:hypothetical protein
MQRIVTSIDIAADASAVWDVFMDFSRYPEWNPFLQGIVGEVIPGQRVSNTIRTPDGKTMTFRPTILTLDHGKELRWTGTFLASFLFRGEHYFYVTDLGDGRTRFTQGEQFSGILIPLFKGLITQTLGQFHDMNAALKERCERA